MKKLSNYINGRWVDIKADRFESINPFSGDVIASAPISSAPDVATAVDAARAAFSAPTWRNLKGSERSARMLALAQVLESRVDMIGEAITRENGKPIKGAKGEVISTVDRLRFFASAARHLDGRFVGTTAPVVWDMEIPEPIGVCALVVPWNDPVDLAVRKLGAALAAGCTVVIKPSEITPASTTLLVEAVHDSGAFPPGVVNLVHGPGAITGEALVSHPAIDKVSFTGSTRTGIRIHEIAAKRFAKVSLECGGKSGSIIFADADLDKAADALIGAAFKYSGQSCTACARLIVQDSIYERFMEMFVNRIRQLKSGDPLDPKVEIGPIACRMQFDKVRRYIDLGFEEGGRALIGSKVGEPVNKAMMIPPTLFCDVASTAKVAQEEIFGPVVVAHPFSTEDEAVTLMNGTVYGLAGSVWSQDITRALRVVRRVDASDLWVNTYYNRNPETSFGGWNMSGIGRELGPAGVAEYVSWRRVCIGL
jgi:acyl-CoA reductase-like NAD-dependent aldehyde dehydrogenase